MVTRAKITLRKEEPTPERKSSDVTGRPDREGKRLISGHFPKSTWTDMRRLALNEDRTMQSLLEEAITDLLSKYGQKAT